MAASTVSCGFPCLGYRYSPFGESRCPKPNFLRKKRCPKTKEPVARAMVNCNQQYDPASQPQHLMAPEDGADSDLFLASDIEPERSSLFGTRVCQTRRPSNPTSRQSCLRIGAIGPASGGEQYSPKKRDARTTGGRRRRSTQPLVSDWKTICLPNGFKLSCFSGKLASPALN